MRTETVRFMSLSSIGPLQRRCEGRFCASATLCQQLFMPWLIEWETTRACLSLQSLLEVKQSLSRGVSLPIPTSYSQRGMGRPATGGGWRPTAVARVGAMSMVRIERKRSCGVAPGFQKMMGTRRS